MHMTNSVAQVQNPLDHNQAPRSGGKWDFPVLAPVFSEPTMSEQVLNSWKFGPDFPRQKASSLTL